MSLVLCLVILLISFYLLARVCDDYFVVSLEHIAERLKLSHDMTGATLMAIGSSAPELFVSLLALIKPGNHAAIGLGTIVGSALFNILVIIGVTASIKKATIPWQPIVRDLLFYTIAILLLMFFFQTGYISLLESSVLVSTYFLYLFAVFYWRRLFPYEDQSTTAEEYEEEVASKFPKINAVIERILEKCFPHRDRHYATFFTSVFIIGVLCWILVESAVKISHILNIPEVIIALTVLAIGTSIPDLISSYLVAKQGKGAMAISNALGSNIFDILICLGLPWLIMILITGQEIAVSTEGIYESIFLLLGTVFVTFIALYSRKWRIDYKNGYFLIGLYLIYLTWSIFQAL